jgi:hypothetical protein
MLIVIKITENWRDGIFVKNCIGKWIVWNEAIIYSNIWAYEHNSFKIYRGN